MSRPFWKYHALGNDYLVLDPADGHLPGANGIVRLCDRHFGVGSDGILWGPIPAGCEAFRELARRAGVSPGMDCVAGVRIWNPDGSEAEKSGNGLRILARHLWDTGRVRSSVFQVLTLGGVVVCGIRDPKSAIRIAMGPVSFISRDIPVTGSCREVLQETISVAGVSFSFSAATVGNPHCVVLRDAVSREETCSLGPLLEEHARFPERTNVQFMKIGDAHSMRIEIWERGAGYTLASGSSACACAAVACRLGMCRSPITVRMPGGDLEVEIDARFRATQTGPVTAVADGRIRVELPG